MKALRILAHAKVNLTLEVLRRREDGFHEIRSLMVPLALADRLTLTPDRRKLSIEVPGDPSLEGEHNLAFRAAESFREHFGLAGLAIRLEKRIPVAAGLGGGSSDAAAVLCGLAELRGIDPGRLPPLAEALGSDVPFFLKEQPARVAGRGERLEPAPRLPALWLMLVKPDFGISAADAYRVWRARQSTDPMQFRTRQTTWEAARTASQVGKLLRNDLQPGCLGLQPALADLLELPRQAQGRRDSHERERVHLLRRLRKPLGPGCRRPPLRERPRRNRHSHAHPPVSGSPGHPKGSRLRNGLRRGRPVVPETSAGTRPAPLLGPGAHLVSMNHEIKIFAGNSNPALVGRHLRRRCGFHSARAEAEVGTFSDGGRSRWEISARTGRAVWIASWSQSTCRLGQRQHRASCSS